MSEVSDLGDWLIVSFQRKTATCGYMRPFKVEAAGRLAITLSASVENRFDSVNSAVSGPLAAFSEIVADRLYGTVRDHVMERRIRWSVLPNFESIVAAPKSDRLDGHSGHPLPPLNLSQDRWSNQR